MESMAHLNKNSAELMLKYNVHGATDVTGFGLMGHAKNLAEAQQDEVDLIIHSLPVIDKMHLKFDNMPNFRVTEGFSAETSGGILCMVDKQNAGDFVAEHMERFGQETWIVGEVTKGNRMAQIRNDH
jgi:selenide, water dikinase